jgi:catechol 2,3-dioxygenase-like lactoylglutathione lyase family enzyme
MKIDHINIVVADLERSATFYERVFGLKRGFAANLEGEWIENVTDLRDVHAGCLFLENAEGGTRIELIRYDSPEGEKCSFHSLPHTFGLRHVAFEVENLEETLSKVRAEGYEPLSEPVEVPFPVAGLGRKYLCYFHDPDGTLLEIAAYHSDFADPVLPLFEAAL